MTLKAERSRVQWHRDRCSQYTFGKTDISSGQGVPEFEHAACILIWGNNPHETSYSRLRDIIQGLKQGARLIVIDPRKTKLAGMADIWLRIYPGTDGVLALSMINVMIDEKLFDYDFVRDWTTAPFLVRSDRGDLLKAADFLDGSDPSSYVIVDSKNMRPTVYPSRTQSITIPVLDTALMVKLVSGEKVVCRTSFNLLCELVSKYPPIVAEKLTGVSAVKIQTQ